MSEHPTQVLPPVGGNVEAEPSENGQKDAILGRLSQKRKELQPLGKTTILEVPGYEHCLGVEYNYIDSDATEEIGSRISKELRATGGKGETFLASIETLIAACKQIVIRDNAGDEWRPISKPLPVGFTPNLAELLDFDAATSREVVIGVFGSEHSIIQQNISLSRWLSDVTRSVDEDFLGI